IQAELRGLELDVVRLSDYQELVPNYYTPVIISSEDYISSNPKVTEKFMEATARGYNFAIDHPEQAADILIEYTPESDPKLIRESQQWLAPRYRDQAPYWGYQEQEVWQEFADWMYDRGLIEEEFAAGRAFTNEFLPGAGRE
ncbi:MAG: ABC transporter substrate-binding protein, partial [Bacillota bacterium]